MTVYRNASCAMALLVLGAATAPASAQWPPTEVENLQVLPDTIAISELVGLMGSFTRALGVRCTYCHAGRDDEPLSSLDFASDEKLPKRKAREMLRMLHHINSEHLPPVEGRATPPVQVQCVTCHAGRPLPRQLEEVLLLAYDGGGLDSTLATYHLLREEYYGRAAYDFGSVPLTVVADGIRSRSLSDAVDVLALNLEMNPTSLFSQRQYARFALEQRFRDEGVESGVALYRELRERHGQSALPEFNLNGLGYALLGTGKAPEAVAVFELMVEAYPESANAYDSLGEGYVAVGDVARAITNYERSLELNPRNNNARAKLRELRARP